MNNQLLRQIPKVDDLLKMPVLEALLEQMPAQTVTRAVRQALDDLRQSVLEGKIEELPTRDAICAKIAVLACRENTASLRRSSTVPVSFCIPIWAVPACLRELLRLQLPWPVLIPIWSSIWLPADAVCAIPTLRN